MFVTLVLLAISGASAQIYVSKSATRDNSSLIKNSVCLSRGNYVFLDPKTTNDSNIEKVTWHIKNTNQSLVKNKIYKDLFWPYDYYGGSTCNANLWDTTDNVDGEYFIYANIYKNNTISERFKERIVLCNNYTMISSLYQNITNPTIVTSDTLVAFRESFLTVMPCDDIKSVVFSFDNRVLPNSVFSTASKYVTNINDLPVIDKKKHTLEAKILTVQNKIITLSIVISPILPTRVPTNIPTNNPIETPTPTAAPTAAPTFAPTVAPTSIPSSNLI